MVSKVKQAIFILAIITIVVCSSCLIYLTSHLITEKKTNDKAMLSREDTNIKILYNNSSNTNPNNDYVISLVQKNATLNISDTKLTNFVKCLHSVSDNNVNDELKSQIDELNTYFKSDKGNFAFYYEDLSSGLTLSFNSKQEVFAASVIKAPVAIYIYNLANEKKINLDDKLTYTKDYYLGGTGIIKNQHQNTEYTIRDLVKYSIIYSDNIAYKMLIAHFGMNDIRKYWQDLGSTTILANGELFSNISAVDGGLTMKQLYKFSLNDNDLSHELLSYFTSEEIALSLIKADTTVAHKYGWSGTAIHDMALIQDNNPYVLIILTTKGEQDNYEPVFTTTSNYISKIHSMYTKNKEENCINQHLKD